MGGCGFWKWYDPPICAIAKQFIPILRDEMIEVKSTLSVKEGVISTYESETRKLQEEVMSLRGAAVSVIGHEKGCAIKRSNFASHYIARLIFFVVAIAFVMKLLAV